MVKTVKSKDKYIVPLVDVCPLVSDILCESEKDPEDWGNEPLIPGTPWT